MYSNPAPGTVIGDARPNWSPGPSLRPPPQPVGDLTEPHEGKATISQGLGLQVEVAKTPGHVQSQVGLGEEVAGIDYAAADGRHRHPSLLDARHGRLGDEPVGAAEPARASTGFPDKSA